MGDDLERRTMTKTDLLDCLEWYTHERDQDEYYIDSLIKLAINGYGYEIPFAMFCHWIDEIARDKDSPYLFYSNSLLGCKSIFRRKDIIERLKQDSDDRSIERMNYACEVRHDYAKKRK